MSAAERMKTELAAVGIAGVAGERLAAALDLGLAWQEAEAALPEGWGIGLFRTDPDEPGRWAAEAEPPTGLVGVTGHGDTPAAAFRNLTEKLRGAAR